MSDKARWWQDRSEVLLHAAYALLQKQHEEGFVLNLLEETVYYDEAECDGNCLMEDIGMHLGIEDAL